MTPRSAVVDRRSLFGNLSGHGQRGLQESVRVHLLQVSYTAGLPLAQEGCICSVTGQSPEMRLFVCAYTAVHGVFVSTW